MGFRVEILLLGGAEGREGRIAASRDYIRRFEGQDVARKVIDIYLQKR
jgi:hypothetical protein